MIIKLQVIVFVNTVRTGPRRKLSHPTQTSICKLSVSAGRLRARAQRRRPNVVRPRDAGARVRDHETRTRPARVSLPSAPTTGSSRLPHFFGPGDTMVPKK